MCSTSRMYGEQADQLFDCVIRMMCQDGITHPEVQMRDISYVHLMDTQYLEMRLEAKDPCTGFRCSLANLEHSKLTLKAYIGKHPNPIKGYFYFMPLDTLHCRSEKALQLLFELDVRKSYSMLVWAPDTDIVIHKVLQHSQTSPAVWRT